MAAAAGNGSSSGRSRMGANLRPAASCLETLSPQLGGEQRVDEQKRINDLIQSVKIETAPSSVSASGLSWIVPGFVLRGAESLRRAYFSRPTDLLGPLEELQQAIEGGAFAHRLLLRDPVEGFLESLRRDFAKSIFQVEEIKTGLEIFDPLGIIEMFVSVKDQGPSVEVDTLLTSFRIPKVVGQHKIPHRLVAQAFVIGSVWLIFGSQASLPVVGEIFWPAYVGGLACAAEIAEQCKPALQSRFPPSLFEDFATFSRQVREDMKVPDVAAIRLLRIRYVTSPSAAPSSLTLLFTQDSTQGPQLLVVNQDG